MSIPIKTQLFGIELTDGNETNWDGLLILKDGSEFGNPKYGYSYYGLRENKMHALSRSYAGQVIKQSLKTYSADYHDLRYLANQAAKRDDFDAVDELREESFEVHEMCVKPLMIFWQKFRCLKPAKPVKPDSRVKANATGKGRTNDLKGFFAKMDAKCPPERSRRSKCPKL